ncbi:MAG TPA: hypothetical protein HPP81_06705 [Deltaproteobacteria bacterium]|jgi:hypothetical protein|nr:hypothetical protein [Deltaproteobacteria bacterium]
MSVRTDINSNPRLFGTAPLKRKAVFLSVCVLLSVLYAFRSDYNLATGSGNLCMFLFIAANVYFPAKRIRIHYQVKEVQAQFNKLLIYHIWLNTASFAVACLHCYITLWSNNWLMFALFIMGWLTFGGFLMWLKYPPAKVKKGIYILHTQQVLFFIMIYALLKGHYVF